jgi:hypothetical protein
MAIRQSPRFFVGQLDEKSYRPSAQAEFEVQILGPEGTAERCAYIGRDSNQVIALVDFTTGPKLLSVEGHGIPAAVIEAARQRRGGHGEYVNELGEVVQPSFLPPWKN